MAILSDYQDQDRDQSVAPSSDSSKTFTAVLDPSKPIALLESAVGFLSENSDLFKSESGEKSLISVIRSARKRHDQEIKKQRMEEEMEAKKAEEERKKKLLVPNKNNGLDMENHSWGQSLQEVTVTVPVPVGTRSRDVIVEIRKNHIKVGLKGAEAPVVDGELFKPVKPDDSIWSIEDQRAISILLTKVDRQDWWKSLLKGGPEVDTQKAEPEPSRLSDLDGETRSAVEKMMFDQGQKQKGLPTSEEIKNQEMLKMFMDQNPNFNFNNPQSQAGSIKGLGNMNIPPMNGFGGN